MRRTVVVLSVLAAIALLGLSTATAAEEMYLVRDGKPLNEFQIAGADGKFVPATPPTK